jgi:hypothetical protein
VEVLDVEQCRDRLAAGECLADDVSDRGVVVDVAVKRGKQRKVVVVCEPRS